MQNDLETYKQNLINKYLISIHKQKANDHPDFSFAELNVTDLIEANERDIENAKKINVNFEYWLDFDYWCNLIYAIDIELGCDAGIEKLEWSRGQFLLREDTPRRQSKKLNQSVSTSTSRLTSRRTRMSMSTSISMRTSIMSVRSMCASTSIIMIMRSWSVGYEEYEYEYKHEHGYYRQ